MGEPSLFWVGGIQPKVMLDVVAAFGGGGVTGEALVVVVLGVVVVEPLPFVLGVVVDVVELALVLLVAAAPAALAPPSAPQPASAIARLPIKDAITTRPAPTPRSPVMGHACLIPTPEK